MIEIRYANNNVEYYFKNLRALQKDFGPDLAKKVSRRIDELRSFGSVSELLNSGIDNPHLLNTDLNGCIGWDLSSNVRLIIRIANEFEEDTIEKTKTLNEVIIEGVRDYHGGNKKWIIN